MGLKKTLFDEDIVGNGPADGSGNNSSNKTMEVPPLDRLKNLEEKINSAVERVKALKEEKNLLEKKIRDLEALLNEKSLEIEALRSEKSSIGSQLEELLNE